jgi:hypothetical protein
MLHVSNLAYTSEPEPKRRPREPSPNLEVGVVISSLAPGCREEGKLGKECHVVVARQPSNISS